MPCCRLYREGEDLWEIRTGDRGWKLSAEESALLKEVLPQGSYKHREHCRQTSVCCRLYREWEDLWESLKGDRGRKLSAEESALLRSKGAAALDALLQIVMERVLDFISPGAVPTQARTAHMRRPIACT